MKSGLFLTIAAIFAINSAMMGCGDPEEEEGREVYIIGGGGDEEEGEVYIIGMFGDLDTSVMPPTVRFAGEVENHKPYNVYDVKATVILVRHDEEKESESIDVGTLEPYKSFHFDAVFHLSQDVAREASKLPDRNEVMDIPLLNALLLRCGYQVRSEVTWRELLVKPVPPMAQEMWSVLDAQYLMEQGKYEEAVESLEETISVMEKQCGTKDIGNLEQQLELAIKNAAIESEYIFYLAASYVLEIKAAGELPAGELRTEIMTKAVFRDYPARVKILVKVYLDHASPDSPNREKAEELLKILEDYQVDHP